MNESTPPQPKRVWRTLLILGVIIVGLGLYSQWGLEEAVAPGGSLNAAESSDTNLAPTIPGPANSAELTERLEQPDPFLEVEVVDGEGALVEHATVLLEGPLGRKLEGGAKERWDKMATGAWTVSATAEGYFDKSEGINLRKGKDGQLQVTMTPAAIIEGQLLSTFRQPLIAGRIFFLKEGEEIPRLPKDHENFAYSKAKRGGDFVSPPLTEGRYRISVRGPGRTTLDSEYITIKEGERRRAEILLDRGALCRVEFIGMDLPRGSRLALLENEGRGIGRRNQEDETAELSDRDKERMWTPGQREDIRDGGPVEFKRLKSGEYKVEVTVPQAGRFRSVESFTMPKTESVVVRVQLPATAPAERLKEVQEIGIEVIQGPADMPLAEAPGIRWLN